MPGRLAREFGASEELIRRAARAADVADESFDQWVRGAVNLRLEIDNDDEMLRDVDY